MFPPITAWLSFLRSSYHNPLKQCIYTAVANLQFCCLFHKSSTYRRLKLLRLQIYDGCIFVLFFFFATNFYQKSIKSDQNINFWSANQMCIQSAVFIGQKKKENKHFFFFFVRTNNDCQRWDCGGSIVFLFFFFFIG